MKTLGIVGGIGPESTIDYYRRIITLYRKLNQDGSYPAIIINSIDMKEMLDFIEANELVGLTDYLLREVQKLADAGADLGLLASNSPHIVFDELSSQSPIPLLSIVEAACEATKKLGLKRVGLLGTRFSMQGRYYPDVFSGAGISVITPGPDEQVYIHDKYMNELVNGVIRSETHERLLAIVERLKAQEGIEGVILGGTELPLILREEAYQGLPFLDTTKIHVERAVAEMLAE
ncbi:MAG: amino acid racemase [Dehalococcoidia bacterium]|nr:amino acid racemase [Dehalococcoidia bacterium]